MKTANMFFGRFQPPTKAHEMVFNYIYMDTRYNSYSTYIFVSPSHDKKKNPLSLDIRLTFLQKVFPLFNFTGIAKNPFDAICELGKMGYESVMVYTGNDHLKGYPEFRKYINHPDPKKRIPTVQNIQFIICGEDRNLGSCDKITAMSATRARKAVANDDFKTFVSIIPDCSLEDQKTLFESIKSSNLNF